MKKLTAGIFAGILTIVTVNAADAAIATSGYVTEKVGAVDAKVGVVTDLQTTAKTNTVAAINEVVGKVSTNTTNIATNTSDISDLKSSVKDLTTGDNSVAQQIANKLGEGFPADSTVKKELDKKANQTALDETNANVTANTSAISAANEKITANTNSITTLNGADTVVGSVDYKIKQKIDEVNDATDGLNERVTANTNSINTLNGADTVEGSVDYKIKQEIDKVNGAASTLAGRVSANEGAIQTLNGTGEGSVKKALVDAKAYADTAESDAVAASKAYADGLNTAMGERVATAEGKIETNKTDIAGINTKIGTLPEGETSVVTMIKKVENAAGSDLTNKLGNLGGKTVAAALAEKQDMLDGENVVTDGTGNVITAVTAENGTVTVKKGMVMPEVPATAKGETGTYVLTATVTDTGITNYMWESIERAAAQSENP